MDPAYFVGKNAILKFLNDTLQINYNKIEQTASGAAHAQLLDILYPGRVPLHKINFDAKYEYEFVNNFKVLQSVFDNEGITKHIDVGKLTKAKYQDNLEFCQWIKNFFESKVNSSILKEYDPVQRREQAKQSYKKGHKHAGTGSKLGVATASTTTRTSTNNALNTVTNKVANNSNRSPASKPRVSAVNNSKSTTSKPTTPNHSISVNNDEFNRLQVTLETMQKERDFYFGKLREIEILCQTDSDNDIMANMKKQILDILYHSDEPEFVSPAIDDNDNVEQELDNVHIQDENRINDQNNDDGLLAL